MIEIQDLRGKLTKRIANSHTGILEEIVEHSYKPSKLKKISSQIYDFGLITGAGALAGYMLSGYDADTSIQFAEYSCLLLAGFKLGFEFPLIGLKKIFNKKIRRFCSNLENKTKLEWLKLWRLDKKGKLEKYKPKNGVSFSNHYFNLRAAFENKIESMYSKNIETAKNPLSSTVVSVVGGALTFLFASLAMDVGAGIFEYITSLNPIELGIESIHYATEQIQSLVGYTPQTSYQPEGNFPQWPMLCTGAAFGLARSTKEFLVGNYYRARALLKRTEKE